MISHSKKTIEIFDITATIIGIALICIGMYQIYKPFGLITAGIFLSFPDQIQSTLHRKKGVK